MPLHYWSVQVFNIKLMPSLQCEANGIPDDRKEAQKLRRLEMFMQARYDQIRSLEAFSNLTELFFVQQNFTRIEGLDSLVHLESLWIMENPHLVRIEGLTNCRRLRNLFLSVFRFIVYPFLTPFPSLTSTAPTSPPSYLRPRRLQLPERDHTHRRPRNPRRPRDTLAQREPLD